MMLMSFVRLSDPEKSLMRVRSNCVPGLLNGTRLSSVP